jgi:hypothetical protein
MIGFRESEDDMYGQCEEGGLEKVGRVRLTTGTVGKATRTLQILMLQNSEGFDRVLEF